MNRNVHNGTWCYEQHAPYQANELYPIEAERGLIVHQVQTEYVATLDPEERLIIGS